VRRARFLAPLALLLSCAAPARAADESAGTAAGSFLILGAGASVPSMAGATLASGRDLAAVEYNPASLARVDALQFSLSHAPLPGGATQDWLAAGGRLGAGRTRWGLRAVFQQEGALEGRDALDNPTGTLSVSDLAVGARLAHSLSSALSAGVGAQWVHESLAGSNGSGFAFDAGLRLAAGPLGFALAGRNLGGGMSYGGTRYDLPGVLAAGVSWSDEARGLRLDADVESPLHYYRGVRVGGEWMWHDRIALRGGYRLELDAPAGASASGATFGLGAGVGTTWLDYAYAPDDLNGGGQHRIGLTFRPGGSTGHAAAAARSAHEPAEAPHAAAREPKPTPSLRDMRPPVESAKPAPAARSTPAPAAAASVATPRPNAIAPAVPAPPAPRPTSVVVAAGETLSAIARRFGTSVATLMMLNDLVSPELKAGQRLKLPPEPNARVAGS
jgi:LysM repeat protein